MMIKLGAGKRKNSGKVRIDLAMPPHAIKEVAKVMTIGGLKYGERNWEQGQKWSIPIASMMRHFQSMMLGDDVDPETGCLHAAHIAANAMFVCEYAKTYPQGDDRFKPFLAERNIGLDIDEVLADFVSGYMKHTGRPERPRFWNFSKEVDSIYKDLIKDKDFWVNLPLIESPDVLTFEPKCYITARPIPIAWTEEWMEKHGFPYAPILSTVHEGKPKHELCKEQEVDIFVDDNYEHFKSLMNNGVFCYLRSADHNLRYNVGHQRINSLKELSYHEDIGGSRWVDGFKEMAEALEKKGSVNPPLENLLDLHFGGTRPELFCDGIRTAREEPNKPL